MRRAASRWTAARICIDLFAMDDHAATVQVLGIGCGHGVAGVHEIVVDDGACGRNRYFYAEAIRAIVSGLTAISGGQ